MYLSREERLVGVEWKRGWDFGADAAVTHRYRAPASSLMTLLNWTLSFIITKTFQSMVCSPLGSYGTFWLYGGICVVGVLFVLTKVPETRGKSLEEIEEYFKTGKGGGAAGDGNRLVLITSVTVAIITGILIALLLK